MERRAAGCSFHQLQGLHPRQAEPLSQMPPAGSPPECRRGKMNSTRRGNDLIKDIKTRYGVNEINEIVYFTQIACPFAKKVARRKAAARERLLIHHRYGVPMTIGEAANTPLVSCFSLPRMKRPFFSEVPCILRHAF